MKETKKTSVEGDWAKVNKDFKDGDRLKILDAGRKIEGDYGPRSVFKIMTTGKKEYNMTFNQTSKNNLIDAWGPETEDWVNKVVKAFVVRQMVGDSLKPVAYLAPEDWTMDDNGKFKNPNATVESPAEGGIDYPKDEINPDDIPF